MTDIFLFPGETSPSDIRLRDPTTPGTTTVGVQVATGGGAARPRKVYYQALFCPIVVTTIAVAATAVGIPLEMGGAAPRVRPVYYQARFETPYVAPAVVAATPNGWQAPLSVAANPPNAQQGFVTGPFGPPLVTTLDWQAPLSIALPPAKAQAGSSFVPFNTAQLSVNFTTTGWESQPPAAAPVAKAQQGTSFVPFDTRQLSVNFTNFGWHGPTSTAAPVAKSQAGFSFVPFDTRQLSVNFTNLGWHPPPPPAAPVARAQPGSAFVPFNTVQTQYAANYTNLGWYAPLAGAPAVAKARQGDSFVPYNTAPAVAYSTVTAIPLDMGGAAPRLRTTYYQRRFDAPYVAPAAADTIIGIPLDIGGVAPSYRTVFHQSLFEPPFQVPPAVQGWWSPLSVAVPVAKAQDGFGFTVPFNTTQVIVAYSMATAIPLDMGGAGPRLRRVYYQSKFETQYVAPVAVAGIAGIAWFSPLGTIPTRLLAAPQGNAFVPFNTVQFIPPVVTPPVETPPDALGGTTSTGGGGYCRKTWKKCLEEIRQQLADEQASLKAAKARHDADIDYAARAARIADIRQRAAALEADCAAESLAVASARIDRFIDKLTRIEADYQAALLRQFEEDEDDVLTILLT